MVSGRLKDIIYKKLCEDLSHVEIIEYNDEIWFIDREDKFWYFIYNKSNGEMWWRYSFFTPFFSLFSLPSDDFTFILSSWVEEVLNCKVTTTNFLSISSSSVVEEVLNCKVTTTSGFQTLNPTRVEEVLNHKVTTTQGKKHQFGYRVDEVLSYKVNKTGGAFYNTTCVEEVLNNEV